MSSSVSLRQSSASLFSRLSPALIEGKFSDARLICDDGCVVHAHQLVLAAISPMLREALRYNLEEVAIVSVPWISSEKLKRFLFEVYGLTGEDAFLLDDDHVALGIDVRFEPSIKIEQVQEDQAISQHLVKEENSPFEVGHIFSESPNVRLEDLKTIKPKGKKWGRKPKVIETQEERTCSQCNKIYSSKKAMLYHFKVVHSGLRPYKCEDCGLTFARIDCFRQHTHSNKRPFLCSHCGKTFTRRHIRDRHERSHRNERPHVCQICQKRFSTAQKLTIHERTHKGERPYQCSECGRQFTQKHQLTTHSRIHTGERPYDCRLCGQKFKHLSTRNNHSCPRRIDDASQRDTKNNEC